MLIHFLSSRLDAAPNRTMFGGDGHHGHWDAYPWSKGTFELILNAVIGDKSYYIP